MFCGRTSDDPLASQMEKLILVSQCAKIMDVSGLFLMNKCCLYTTCITGRSLFCGKKEQSKELPTVLVIQGIAVCMSLVYYSKHHFFINAGILALSLLNTSVLGLQSWTSILTMPLMFPSTLTSPPLSDDMLTS